MADIVVFGGTTEGRILAEVFKNTDVNLHICTATEYGGTLLPDGENIFVHTGRMNEDEMTEFLRGLSVDYCIDATHPYAVLVSENIYKACEKVNLKYMRVLREEGKTQNTFIYKESIEDAVQFLNNVQGNVFVTTGSKELEKYIGVSDYKNRCFARVLPTLEVMQKCSELGFEGKNVVAMQGPFDEELNYCIMKQINAKWLVTKNSGTTGGFEQKCRAAERVGANIIVIGRPAEVTNKFISLENAVNFLREEYNIKIANSNEKNCKEENHKEVNCNFENKSEELKKENHTCDEKRKIYIIGMGVGSEKLLTAEAIEYLEKCDVIIGAKRVAEIYGGNKPVYVSYKKDDIVNYIDKHTEYKNIALVYSGDIGFYSGARGMTALLENYDVHNVCGISSPIYFMNKLGKNWDDAKFVSLHGQDICIIPQIRKTEKVCAILGSKTNVSEICKTLVEFDMNYVRVTVGERLSYADEKIKTGFPSDFVDVETDKLAVALFENSAVCEIGYGISDDEFIRGNVPMTKEEIRVVALSKLKLKKNSILYDIGAGTGSVSVEAALQCDDGFVYAVERKANAVRLIKQNRKKFKTENLKVVEGEAPYCFDNLPKPTHAFIGGSNGRMLEIIRAVRARNKNVRFVINAVTIETLTVLDQVKKEFPQYDDMEIIQLNVSRSKELGRYHLMEAENPVYVISFGGKR